MSESFVKFVYHGQAESAESRFFISAQSMYFWAGHKQEGFELQKPQISGHERTNLDIAYLLIYFQNDLKG